MLTNISIKNIKSYNTEANLRIAPVTLIYGSNSAGKSTLWKFFLALKESTGSFSSRGFLNLIRSDFANMKTLAFDRSEDSTFALNFTNSSSSDYSTIFKFNFSTPLPDEYKENFKELTELFSDKELLAKLSPKQKKHLLKGIDQLLETKKEFDENKKNIPNYLKPEKSKIESIKIKELEIFQKTKSFINFNIVELPLKEKITNDITGIATLGAKIVAKVNEKEIMQELQKHYKLFFAKEKLKFEVKVKRNQDIYHKNNDEPFNPIRVFDMVGPNGPKEFKINKDHQMKYLFLPTKISKDKSLWTEYYDFLQLLKKRMLKNNEKKIKEGKTEEDIFKSYINESFFDEHLFLEHQYGVSSEEFPQIDKTFQNTLKAMTGDINDFIKILSEDLETFIMSGTSFIPTHRFYGAKIFKTLFDDIPDRFLDAYLGNIDENNKLVPPTKEAEEFIKEVTKFTPISLVDQVRNLYKFTDELKNFKKSSFNSIYPLGTIGSSYGINKHLTGSIHTSEEFKKKITNLLEKVGLPFDIKSKYDDNGSIILSFENKKISKSKFDNKEIPLDQSGNALKSILLLLSDILRSKNSVIILEEPENKLHPKIQGNLVELILFLAIENENRIIIETHSEHFILRIQKLLREKKLNTHDVAINYVYLDENGDGSKIDHMDLDQNGKFINKWRHGFFSERLNEL